MHFKLDTILHSMGAAPGLMEVYYRISRRISLPPTLVSLLAITIMSMRRFCMMKQVRGEKAALRFRLLLMAVRHSGILLVSLKPGLTRFLATSPGLPLTRLAAPGVGISML